MHPGLESRVQGGRNTTQECPTQRSSCSFSVEVSGGEPFEKQNITLLGPFRTSALLFFRPSVLKLPVPTNRPSMISYLNQADAQQLDNELFTEYAYSVDQLMELAGLSCATAIAKAYPRDELRITNGALLVCCGPGNNGGDGLVCARHLKMFGYNPTICYPRTPTKQLYKNLVRQCEKMNIDFFQAPTPEMASQWGSSYNLIVDALFGFGFKPPVSAEFKTLLDYMCQAKIPVVSIDVPSGFHYSKLEVIYTDVLSRR
ncbi:hypothetical protein CRM22_005746 [Opisthorchis felineus]|uniref:NAD(P)H-hydrate epimerase n=1 Tax=Opisthorchis felineus TaxID=147828 RepID=A0A4S2LPQ2_OPIFE|nr:hypothetical protein CRM22_005746 [Opisthorchis felineus]